MLFILRAGTLLDSNSKILPSSVSALKAALNEGVLVCLATGKARPAAISALQSVGLAGVLKHLLVYLNMINITHKPYRRAQHRAE